MKDYRKEMKICLQLAKRGLGRTCPNPLVGCVVLNSKGDIVSVGYHKKYGELHAERNALNKLEDAKDCTLVVNLEPCVHQGKTPPCTDIIIKKGIKRVVYGMEDPNPLVSGKGLEKLREAGIEVFGPVLEKECEILNEVFIKNQTEQKTFVAIKTAATLDGKIATRSGDSKWITSEKSRKYSKKLRKIYDAILTSSSTVIADDPEMKHNKKVIIDTELKTDLNSKIYAKGEIIIFCDENHCPKQKSLDNGRILYVPAKVLHGKIDVEFVLDKLFELGIMSVFAEAGGNLLGSILPYADKIYQFIAPKILADNSAKSCFDGVKKDLISQCLEFNIENIKKIDSDILVTYKK